MKKVTIKKKVLEFLKDKDWTSGTVIGLRIFEELGSKPATVDRRCRELRQAGLIKGSLMKNRFDKIVIYYRL